MTQPTFSTLTISLSEGIADSPPQPAGQVERDERRHVAGNPQRFRRGSTACPKSRVAILSGEGRNFCAGIDLSLLARPQRQQVANPDGARSREALRRLILDMQDCLTSRRALPQAGHRRHPGRLHRRRHRSRHLPATCASRRPMPCSRCARSTSDIVADVGTLQRLPRLIPEGNRPRTRVHRAQFRRRRGRETGPRSTAIFASPEALTAGVRQLAQAIAAKSPLATRGIKEVMNYSRDHSVADGLNFVATWNAAMLLSADLNEAITAQREKRAPRVSPTDLPPRRFSRRCGRPAANNKE
jgi:enoyl-CoA hydratase